MDGHRGLTEQGGQDHAILSPSSAERWLSCPASVAEIAKAFPDGTPSSSYADEGTAAHALAAAMVADTLSAGELHPSSRLIWSAGHPEYADDFADMHDYLTGYVELIRERLAQDPTAELLLEQRFETGIPGCWGTMDAVIVGQDTLEVIDLKYGQGVAVSAQDNPQLRLYALAAYNSVGRLLGEPREIRMTIHQPRLNSVSVATMTVDELLDWARTVAEPAAQEALTRSDRFGPSESACRWCPLRGRCRAHRDWAIESDWGDLVTGGASPALLTDAEIADELRRAPVIRAYLTALETIALQRAYVDGTEIPGFKIVRSGQRRQIVDEAGALERLTQDLGYPAGRVTRVKLVGIGELEKLLGREDFATMLGEYVALSEGKPALVPQDDKRPVWDVTARAADEFRDLLEGGTDAP